MASRVDLALLRSWAPRQAATADKESRGRVLVIGGDAQTAGGVILAGEAALRVGAGKLQLGCHAALQAAVAVAVPEALVVDRDGVAALAADADVVLVGPGLGDPDAARLLVERLLPAVENVPLVLDALAVSAADMVKDRSAATLLTPNATEAAHALGWDEVDDGTVEAAALELADRYQAVIALGAGLSVCATPGGAAWTDSSGDVKAGAVAGWVARGLEPQRAAVLATWLHARAGERCGPIGYLAREIAAELPHALAELSD